MTRLSQRVDELVRRDHLQDSGAGSANTGWCAHEGIAGQLHVSGREYAVAGPGGRMTMEPSKSYQLHSIRAVLQFLKAHAAELPISTPRVLR